MGYKGKTNAEYYAEWQKKNREKQNAYKLAWRNKNKTKVRKQALDWYYRQIDNKEFKDKIKQRSQEYAQANPEKIKERNRLLTLKRRDITPNDYESLMTNQEGKCAICGATSSGKAKRRLSVDHNHKTGNIRALLCHDCNWMVGYLERREDIPDILVRLTEYLITHNCWEKH
jgi:hypothetical protein